MSDSYDDLRRIWPDWDDQIAGMTDAEIHAYAGAMRGTMLYAWVRFGDALWAYLKALGDLYGVSRGLRWLDRQVTRARG